MTDEEDRRGSGSENTERHSVRAAFVLIPFSI